MLAEGLTSPKPFILRARSRDGRPVWGARLALERSRGFARCYSTAAAAQAFSEAATGIAERELGDAAVTGTYFPYEALNALDDGEAEVTTDANGLARFFCVPDPVISNNLILLPVGPAGALGTVGLSYLRPVWTDFAGENRIVYPAELDVLGQAAAPAFLERWSIGDLSNVATGMVTDGVLGVRLKGKFGGTLGGHSITWTSDVSTDVVVHRDEPNILDPVPISGTTTQVDGYGWVRVFVSAHGAMHTITAELTAAPALTREFEIFERPTSAPDVTDVELRLVRKPENEGHQGAADSLSPVWSRFEAFVRQPSGAWQPTTGTVEILVSADLWNDVDPEPLPVELASPVAVGDTFRVPFVNADMSVQVLKFRAVHLDGVPPGDLPVTYDHGLFQLVAEPRVRIERILPDFSRKTVPAGGLVLTNDLGVAFATANPADYELRARLDAQPDPGEGALVLVPTPEHTRRFSIDGVMQPDAFALLSSEWLFSEALFGDSERWATSRVTLTVPPNAGIGNLDFEVLAPREEAIVADAGVFVGTARVTQVEEPGEPTAPVPGTINLDGDHRTVRDVRVRYELRLPAGLAATSVSLELAGADDAVVQSFELPTENTTEGELVVPTGTYLGTNQFVSARLHIDEWLVTDTVSPGQLVRLAPYPCGRCREEDGGTGVTIDEHFCIQPYSLEHPQSNLNALDYYPALGTKTIRLCVADEAGAWGRGTVSAAVEVREPGDGGEYVGVPEDASLLGKRSGNGAEAVSSGLVEYQLAAETAMNPHILAATFTWQPPGGHEHSVEVEFRVRDNSNVSIGDVLNGTAVFVAETREPGEPGILTRPGTVESPRIPGQEATAHHFAAWDERRADSLQFMLNQVVPRYDDAMMDYQAVNWGNGLPENGKYDGSTKEALAVFRQYFGYENDPALGDDIEALKREYDLDNPPPAPTNPLPFSGGAFDPLGVVGTYVFLRGEAGEYDPDHRCFGQTSLADLDEPCGPPNAGLFELYENVVKVFIERKIEAMESYVNLDAPVTQEHWYSRPFWYDHVQVRQRVPLPVGFVPTTHEERVMVDLDDARNGVAYCYGCSEMNRRVQLALAENSFWDDFTLLEQQNVFEETVSSVQPPTASGVSDEAEVIAILPFRYPGLYLNELLSWASNVDHGIAADLQYAPKYWAGIDCSGLAWLAAEYATRGEAFLGAAVDPRWPSYPDNLRDDPIRLLGRVEHNVVSMVQHAYPLRPGLVPANARFWAHVASEQVHFAGELVTNQVAANTLRDHARRGDLLIVDGHVGTTYSDGGVAVAHHRASAWSIEASGGHFYVRRVGVDPRQKFGRKAIVRDLSINPQFQPRVALRETLWQRR